MQNYKMIKVEKPNRNYVLVYLHGCCNCFKAAMDRQGQRERARWQRSSLRRLCRSSRTLPSQELLNIHYTLVRANALSSLRWMSLTNRTNGQILMSERASKSVSGQVQVD